MKLVARFLSTGIAIYYAAGVFYIDGNGPISRRRLSKLEKEGGVIWLDEETHEQFLAGFPEPAPAPVHIADDAVAVPRGIDVRGFTFGVALIIALALGAVVSDYAATMRTNAVKQDALAHAARVAAVKAPVDAEVALVTLTQDGLTYDSYKLRVNAAVAAVAAYKPEDDATRKIAESLGEANHLYVGAVAAWEAARSDDPQAYARFRAERPDLGLVPGSAPDAVQQLWARAAGQTQDALVALDAYDAAGAQKAQ